MTVQKSKNLRKRTVLILVLFLALCYIIRKPVSYLIHGYRVQVLDLERNGKRICGRLYLPKAEEPLPAVILSHGFNANMEAVERYAEIFAENGIAAYIFDFTGGGTRIRSDGATTEMSVLTERMDLETVLEAIRSDSHIQKDQIFLMGTSLGGFVSVMTAARHPKDVAGLILLYPAFQLQKDFERRIADPERYPTKGELMGTPISEMFVNDLLSFDIYQTMKKYRGQVLIIHGTKDPIVSIPYSERAVKVFKHAELYRIEGGGHGFKGKQRKEAAEQALGFIQAVLNSQ